MTPSAAPDWCAGPASGTVSGVATDGTARLGLPEGAPDDPPQVETVHGLGNRKNEIVLRRIAADGVEVYPGSIRYLHAVRAAGLGIAVVSSSANAADVLAITGTADLFDVRVDGVVAAREHLRGKPAPDTFLAAARLLGVPPERAVVFEDALAGVEAGRAGGFALVVGVDRVGQGQALGAHGADIVVTDLADLIGYPPRAGEASEPSGSPGGSGEP